MLLRLIACCLFAALPLRLTAQAVFLKGYIIDNTGQRSECYIRPENWRADTYLSYRLHLLDSLHRKPVSELREFAIYSKVKYIISTPTLNRPEDIPDNSEWTEKNLLLNVMVEGRNSLYSSLIGSSIYFFSREATGPIVFLSPRATAGDSAKKAFQLFLCQQFNCQNNDPEYFHSLKYDATSLSGHFLANNRCLGMEGISFPDALAMNASYRPVTGGSILYGFDFLILVGKDETTLDDFGSPITITTKQSGWGMGPRAGIMFQLASQVVIGTETSLYYTSLVRTEEFPGSPDAKQRSRTIELTLPVAILLGIRLGR